MKKPLKITLEELYVGACKTIVSLQIGKDGSLEKFLDDLIMSNMKAAKSLQSAMRVISSTEDYYNDRKFKRVSEEGIYEIKCPGVRLYCFLDDLAGLPRLILVSNGGKKNNAKEQDRDIKKASQIRSKYLNAKNSPAFEFNYIQKEE